MRTFTVTVLLLISLGLAGSVFAQSQSEVQASPTAESESPVDIVDLNSADELRLETLPGIGPRTASLIVEYRATHGPFTKVEEIMNVRGIGERTFLRLRELITVTPPADR